MSGNDDEWTIEGCILDVTFRALDALSGDDPVSEIARNVVMLGGGWLALTVYSIKNIV